MPLIAEGNDRLSAAEREAIEKRAATLPLPDVAAQPVVRWDEGELG